MITTFGINAKKYSDLPLAYAPATGFKWAILTLFIESSASTMTVALTYIKNGINVGTLLSTTSSQYSDAISSAEKDRYSDMELSSLDGLYLTQSAGVTGDTVTAIIEVKVLPA